MSKLLRKAKDYWYEKKAKETRRAVDEYNAWVGKYSNSNAAAPADSSEEEIIVEVKKETHSNLSLYDAGEEENILGLPTKKDEVIPVSKISIEALDDSGEVITKSEVLHAAMCIGNINISINFDEKPINSKNLSVESLQNLKKYVKNNKQMSFFDSVRIFTFIESAMSKTNNTGVVNTLLQIMQNLKLVKLCINAKASSKLKNIAIYVSDRITNLRLNSEDFDQVSMAFISDVLCKESVTELYDIQRTLDKKISSIKDDKSIKMLEKFSESIKHSNLIFRNASISKTNGKELLKLLKQHTPAEAGDEMRSSNIQKFGSFKAFVKRPSLSNLKSMF